MTELPTYQSHLNKSRQNKFTLILSIPNILKPLDNKMIKNDTYLNLDMLQYSVYNINIPSITVPEQSFQMFGQPYNFSSLNRPPYTPSVVNFGVDNEYKNYWVLWKWLNLYNEALQGLYGNIDLVKEKLQTIKSQKEKNLLADYRTTIVVYGKDEYHNDKIKFTFTHALITELGEILFNNKNSEEINCSFKFVFNQLNMELINFS